ncbi:hypothetical protein C4K12_3696 [Pseudomonas chlororaphis subsp. aureofaciens]|nr:hypothetical protein C4K12_3696 [Pseudomonas chlororaphis subsp. aureofaciens]
MFYLLCRGTPHIDLGAALGGVASREEDIMFELGGKAFSFDGIDRSPRSGVAGVNKKVGLLVEGRHSPLSDTEVCTHKIYFHNTGKIDQRTSNAVKGTRWEIGGDPRTGTVPNANADPRNTRIVKPLTAS